MAMIRLQPTGKDYLWGGRRLVERYGKQPVNGLLAESWELSCHADGCCRLLDGPSAGSTLADYLKENPAAAGKNCARFLDFPILIKLIDSAQPLSIQVHPGDAYARANEGDNGKTEVWYIVDCGPGAFIYYGLERAVSREELAAAVEAGTVTKLLRKVPVKKGESYFIEAGTLHAIGPDIVITEVQQNSNVTYRVYDYDRRDAQGNPRTLHKAKAVAVSALTPPQSHNFGGHLALCDYFCVDRLAVTAAAPYSGTAGEDSFVSLLVVEGGGQLTCGGQTMAVQAGESLWLDASSGTYTLAGDCVALQTTIPPGDKPYRIGIDLGGTNIKVGIVDKDNHIVAKKSVKTLVERPWQEVVEEMGRAALSLLAQQGLTLEQCASLGIGSPGTIDAENGVVVYSNNFYWENIPLVAELKKYIDLPMTITNDANAAALGEVVAGAAAGCRNALLLTLGTGVGGGVILEGKVFEGGHPGGAELGHTTLIMGGEPCTCGRKGCLESYASATALVRQARRMAEQHPHSQLAALCGGDLSRMDGIIPFKAARAGDPAGKEVVENYIAYLSEGIVNLVNIFRPQRVIISGGVCGEGAYLTDPVNAYIRRYCFAGDKAFVPPVVTATLGNDAGIIGAANL